MMDLPVPAMSMEALHHGGNDTVNRTNRSERSGYQTSPHVPNLPENNVCEMVDYRGQRVASFSVDGRQLICLPQAFEIFLKHLVGGLHTVYTKLKRLEITPVVCNVEQVRILRGVAAIQPGVNRCKLISPQEFDVLFDDCTSSSARPGRPPKRSSFYPSSDMSDLSPQKQMRRPSTEPNIFQFDDLKPTNPAMLPQHQTGPYPPLPLPSMPFVSPYQINMMHQAAVQMALANHIQSNLSRAKEGVMPPQLLPQACRNNLPPLPAPGVLPSQNCPKPSPPVSHKRSVSKASGASSPPHSTQTSPKYIQGNDNNNNHSNTSTDVERDDTRRTRSPQSCCSDDLDVGDSQIAAEPPATAHSNERLSPPAAVARHSPSSTCQEHLESTNSESGTSPSNEDHSKKVIVMSDEDKQGLDDSLAHLKADIQSFMESILQQQEDILSDIDILRGKIKTNTFSPKYLEKVLTEQRQITALYQRHLDKSSTYKHDIDQLLKITKSDINVQW